MAGVTAATRAGRRCAAIIVPVVSVLAGIGALACAGAVQAEAAVTAQDVSAGQFLTCAVLSSGHVDCWGANRQGQVGNGTTGESSGTPVEVEGISNATQVSAGDGYSCAVLSTGHVECWGENNSGELGNGATERSDTPVEALGISDATQLAAGYAHVCALLSTGHIDCWGANMEGDLGNGTDFDSSDTPVEVVGISDATQVTAGGAFGARGAGEYTCAVLSGGHVDCWGDDEYGQLGDGTSGGLSDSDTPVEVLGISDAAQVAAGAEHTCAVLSTGDVDCWGSNEDGDLGNGMSGERSDTPVEVLGVSNATQVTAGDQTRARCCPAATSTAGAPTSTASWVTASKAESRTRRWKCTGSATPPR
jgi:alpha-tubulin suppressor-like RCC1 family protein